MDRTGLVSVTFRRAAAGGATLVVAFLALSGHSTWQAQNSLFQAGFYPIPWRAPAKVVLPITEEFAAQFKPKLRSKIFAAMGDETCSERVQALDRWAWWRSGDTYRGPFWSPLVRLQRGFGYCVEEQHWLDEVWAGIDAPDPMAGGIGEPPEGAVALPGVAGAEFIEAAVGIVAERGAFGWRVPTGPPYRERSARWSGAKDELLVDTLLTPEPREIFGSVVDGEVAAHWHGGTACEIAAARWLPAVSSLTGKWIGARRTALRFERWGHEPAHQPFIPNWQLLITEAVKSSAGPACTIAWWTW